MDDSILQMFLEDTREHLADIETDLLDIEEAGEDFDLELVNKVFRTAHSIKGSAGFLALDNVRDLSHKIENVLDMIRSREMAPTSSVVNVVLKAFDKLEELVENIEESETIDISAHVRALTGLVTANLPQEQQKEVATHQSVGLGTHEIFSVSAHDLRQAQKGGNFIYLVEYDLIFDVHKKGKTPLDLMKFLQKSGLILDCKLDIMATGDLDDEISKRIPFFILYASILEPDLVKAIFQVEDKYIHNIEPASLVESKATQAPLAPPAKEKASSADLDAMERELDLALAKSGAQTSTAVAPPPVSMKPPSEDTDLFTSTRPAASSPPTLVVAEEQGPESVDSVEGFDIRARGAKACLELTGALTIERGAALKLALLHVIGHYREIALDFEAVKEADVSFLQLIFSALRTADAQGVRIYAKAGIPPVVAALAQRAGFDAAALKKLGLH